MNRIISQRVELPVTIIKDREFSDYKPNVAWKFSMEDKKENKYEWNTTVNPKDSIFKGQQWLIRMTIFAEDECCGDIYKLVKNVKFIKQLI